MIVPANFITTPADTRARILDLAENLLLERGFNALATSILLMSWA